MGMRALFPFGTLGTLGLTFCGRLCARDPPNERFSVLVHPEVLDHDEQLTPRPFEVPQGYECPLRSPIRNVPGKSRFIALGAQPN